MKRLIWFLLILFLFSVQVLAGSQQPSATDAQVIVTRARYLLNDPTIYGGTQKSIWSDAELLQWVNDGSVDIVARSQCLEDIESETLVANTSNYSLTTNFIAIKGVIYNAGTASKWSLEKGNYNGRYIATSFGHLDAMTGPPQYWTEEENDVWIYPIPTANEAGKTIDVILILRPATVGATDDVKVPAYFDRALVLYVAAQGLYKDGKFGKASSIMSQYLAEIDRYKVEYSVQIAKPLEGKSQ
jgi:hypothetical protein